MRQLNEATAKNIIDSAKEGGKYKEKPKENRFSRRTKSTVSSSTATYNKINAEKFFNDDILDFGVPIKGETNNYIVSLSIPGILEELRGLINFGDKLDYRIIQRAVSRALSRQDVKVKCSCPDWQYRIGYYASQNHIQIEPEETMASDITNPKDSFGHACKHVCLVLNSGTPWQTKIARVIINYVHYMESHYPKKYKEIIFPQLYGLPYEKAQLDSDEETINKSNEYGRTRGQFKKGNKEGWRFAKKGTVSQDEDEQDKDEQEINDVDTSKSS